MVAATSFKAVDAAAAEVVRFLRAVANRPGPRGALTAVQILDLQDLLAGYLLTRFATHFCRDELTEIAREAIVTHQATHHAQLTSPDIRAQGDQYGEWLLTLATDRALDEMVARRSVETIPVPKPPMEAYDDELIASIFGEDARSSDVREALCELVEDRDPISFRVVMCYLEVAEATQLQFGDQDVVVKVGIPGLRQVDVTRIMLQFANRLGRE